MLQMADAAMPIRLRAALLFRAPGGPEPELPKPDPEPRPGSAPDYQPSPVPPTPGNDTPGLQGLEPAI